MNQSQNITATASSVPNNYFTEADRLPLSGMQYVINRDGQHAEICGVGAAVRTYQVAEGMGVDSYRGYRDVFVTWPANEINPVHNAGILAPWPNRLGNGSFTFDGVKNQLPITEIDRLNALHGLVSWETWVALAQTENSVTLQYDLPARKGWPYQLRFTVVYHLEEDGLHCDFTATNLGDNAAPYGVGFHPWLSTGGAALDECEVRLAAQTHVIANERLLPAGTEPVGGASDLRERRSLQSLDLDDAWLDPIYDADGRSWCVLYCPDGYARAVWMDKTLPAWQVCSADHIPAHYRFGLAAEPMTCIADAFNTGDLLIRLEPGQSHTVHWGATLLSA